MEKKKENFNNNADFYADTMEHEEAKKIRSALNCEEGIFTNKFSEGLNSNKSVFDKGALFITNQGREG